MEYLTIDEDNKLFLVVQNNGNSLSGYSFSRDGRIEYRQGITQSDTPSHNRYCHPHNTVNGETPNQPVGFGG